MNNNTVHHRGPQRQKDFIEFPAYLEKYWDNLKRDWITSSSESFIYTYLKEKKSSLSEMELLKRAHNFIYDIETGRRSTDCLTLSMLMKHCEKNHVLANDLLYSKENGIDQDAVNQLLEVEVDFVCPLLIDLYFPVSMFLRKTGKEITYIIIAFLFADFFEAELLPDKLDDNAAGINMFVRFTNDIDDARTIFYECIEDCQTEVNRSTIRNVIDPMVVIPQKLEKYFKRKRDIKATLDQQTKKASSPSAKISSRSQI